MKTDNELIAEFIGFNKPDGEIYYHVPDSYKDLTYNDDIIEDTREQLFFDQSWDWLHPIIDKIASLMPSIKMPDDLEALKNGTHGSEPYIDVISLPISSPISEIYEAVVKFIKWYNTTKQEQTEKL